MPKREFARPHQRRVHPAKPPRSKQELEDKERRLQAEIRVEFEPDRVREIARESDSLIDEVPKELKSRALKENDKTHKLASKRLEEIRTTEKSWGVSGEAQAIPEPQAGISIGSTTKKAPLFKDTGFRSV